MYTFNTSLTFQWSCSYTHLSLLVLQVQQLLSYIQRGNYLPPLVVLQTLSRNPAIRLATIKPYLAAQLEQEAQLIGQNADEIARLAT